jgi:hypothetical protein
MKSEVVVREGDLFLFREMETSHIFRCHRLWPNGDVVFVHDRSGSSLPISGRSFASVIRDGKAILVCPATTEAEGHSGGARAMARNPSTPANAPRWGQAYLFSVAGEASRLYVFKGLLRGRGLFFTQAGDRHALVVTERCFESLRRSGRVVPFMPEREAIQGFLHNFGRTMAPDKGFDHPPPHSGQTRH